MPPSIATQPLTWAGSLARLMWLLPGVALVLLRFLLRSRPRHLRTFRAALRALDGPIPCEHGDPLREVSPRVHELDASYLRALGLPERRRAPLTFIHLTGTGEPLHTVLPGLEKLLALQPQLAHHRHVIVDVPDEVEALHGAYEFRDALLRLLEPLLADFDGGLVLMGLSRGGAAALDLGAGWAARSARPIGVVAMSPPLIGDYTRPLTVRDFASFEPFMEQLRVASRYLSPGLRRAQDWLLRRNFLWLTCFTLTQFEMDTPQVIRWAAWDLRGVDPIPAILRANREFAMLCRVTDALLHEVCHIGARAAAAHDNLHLCMLWGSLDSWVPAARCAERANLAGEMAGAPADRHHVEILPGFSHAMPRQLTPELAVLAERVARVADWVEARC